jgi:hypothetical protein
VKHVQHGTREGRTCYIICTVGIVLVIQPLLLLLLLLLLKTGVLPQLR